MPRAGSSMSHAALMKWDEKSIWKDARKRLMARANEQVGIEVKKIPVS